MATLKTRMQKQFSSRRVQLACFGSLAIITMLWIGLQGAVFPRIPLIKGAHILPAPVVTDVAVTAELSQTKLLQGEDGMLYVHLAIQAPDGLAHAVGKTPTDLVVVLDRSPSMLTANKLPFAKAAIRELLHKLDASDRLGLIAFDGRASVYSELVEVTPGARQKLTHIVNTLKVGSATNIGAGLMRARELLEASPSHRATKIILLSDGETNTGITDPDALAKLAGTLSTKKIVVSTIGMGLGFNESLMASLADHGMGNYSYLEQLSMLGTILAQNLDEVRRLYAESSELQLRFATDLQLVDAAGYPIDKITGDGSHVRVKTGQILVGSHKNLILTLKTSTAKTGDFSVGDIALWFNTNGIENRVSVQHEQLTFAVIEPEKKREVVASISRDVQRKSWLRNNLGRMRQQVYHWVKSGNKSKAQEAIDDYRHELREAEKQSGLAISNKKLEESLVQMEAGLEDVFSGPADTQAVKRNRLSKEMQFRGREDQRQ